MTGFVNVSMLILTAKKWKWLLNSWLFAVIIIFQIEKLLRFLSLNSKSSLNILAVNMKAPYKKLVYVALLACV